MGSSSLYLVGTEGWGMVGRRRELWPSALERRPPWEGQG
jgi:hypothetical protein